MYTRKRKRTSSAWDHFTSIDDHAHAQCNVCLKIIKTTRGCTSGLARHLSTHDIYLGGSNKAAPDINPNEIISKLVAEDGLPFSVVAKSTSIRYMYESATNKILPSSSNTIREVMLKCYEEKKADVILQISKLKSEGKKLSVTLDEWTSAANRRYMNINLHTVGAFWNLGLVRITGTFTAEACLELVKLKLNEFDVSLSDDVFAVSTDGAAVMKKFGRLTGRKHLLCLAHAIHLAVVAVLYNQIEHSRTNDNDQGEITVEHEEDLDTIEPPIMDEQEVEPELSVNLKDLVCKVRKNVQLFRKSPLKTEVLMKHSGSTLTLLHDTRTRWNSLLTMLERVLQLKNAIQKAMIDLREPSILSENDFNTIDELVHILRPVRVAVEGICRSDATLITADVAMNFMMGKLAKLQSTVAKNLFEELKIRILERRTILSDVAYYLHFGNDNDQLGHTLGYFTKVTRPALQLQVRNLYEMQETHNHNTNQVDIMESQMEEEGSIIEISLESELSLAISQALSRKLPDSPNSTSKSSRDPRAAAVAALKKEILTLGSVGCRGKMLQSMLDKILSVPPCTVEAERVFSTANNFCRRVRTQLADKSLDALVFLKAYFKNN